MRLHMSFFFCIFAGNFVHTYVYACSALEKEREV